MGDLDYGVDGHVALPLLTRPDHDLNASTLAVIDAWAHALIAADRDPRYVWWW